MKQHRNDKIALAVLAVVCVLAFLLRFYRAGEAFGGYHSFNEGWYSTLALNYRTHSLLFPVSVFGKIDYNVVPFYSYILYAALTLFGDRELIYRTATIIFSVLTFPFIYLIGRRLYGRAAALAAAGIYAFAPASVVVGRNVQTDPVYLCFLFIAIHIYLKSRDEKKPRGMWWSGVFFGLSFFTKQFAILWLPAVGLWELVKGRGLRAFNRGHLYFAAGALLFPAPFFLYHMITRAGEIVKSQAELSASQLHSLSLVDFQQVFEELYWALSPLIFVLCLFAAISMLRGKRKDGDGLLALSTAVFVAFFCVFHGHSYYLLYGIPFISLIGGRFVGSLKPRRIVAPVFAFLLAVSAVQAIAFLCAVKYGYNEFEAAREFLADKKNVTLVLDEDIRGSYRPPVQYYCRNARIVLERDLVAGPDMKSPVKSVAFPKSGKTYLFSFLTRPLEQTPERRLIIKRREYTLLLFGRQIMLELSAEHYFSIKDIRVIKASGWTDTGVRFAGYQSSFMLGEIEPGSVVPVSGGKLTFRPPVAGSETK